GRLTWLAGLVNAYRCSRPRDSIGRLDRPSGKRLPYPAMNNPVRIAIVGTGGIANVHAENVARLDGAEVVAAMDVLPGLVEEFAGKWQIPRRYTSLDDLLRDGDIDLVHLCSPPLVHREQAIAVLERDLPVLAEKPPARSLAEFDEIAAAEARSKGFFATVSQHRFGGRAVA